VKERVLSFEVGDRPNVEVRISSGHIQINEGPAGIVSLSVRSSNPDKLLVEQFRDHIQIGEEGRLRGNYRIRLEVPAGTDIVTAVASGNVDIDGPVGELTARSASGDIAVSETRGRTEVKVASGDVAIRRTGGDTRVVSASGDVTIDDAGDDCAVATASGDIDLGIVAGSLNIKTASGNTIVRRFEGEALVAKSVSGRLELRIPSGRRVDLDIRTLSGRVDLPSPGGSSASAPDREVSVRAKSVSGNIKIDRAA
jgi:DUF4097 and DUF4098 domain-containing protein YvlB